MRRECAGRMQVLAVGGTAHYNGTQDNTYYYSWNLGSVTAVPTPEPGSLVLLGLGGALLALLLKAEGRKKSEKRPQMQKAEN